MSTKTTTHHTRRAPLSLSGGGKQQSQNNYSGKTADSNGNSNNSASAKNDNKHSASQKTESSVNDAKESTPKDLKKPQNAEKKQQLTANNETVKKNEKTDEKKTQNGNGKASANGGTKEKHQNASDKQDNNGNSNSTNAKTSTTNSNGNSNAKSNTKLNEKAPTPGTKEETKTKQQKPTEHVEKSEKVSVKEKEKENEKEKEKDKKKENEQENIVEKETRLLRQETAVTAEPEKKQLEKNEPPRSEDTKMEVATPTSRSSAGQSKPRTTPTTGAEKSGRNTPTRPIEKTSASPRNKIVTTVIDDVEMEPLAMESSPTKSKENTVPVAVAGPVLQPPAATSTPGKAPMSTQKTKTHTVDAKSDHALNALNSGNSPDGKSVPRTITHIGGRRSIRPLTEYTPSKFQSNLQFRESYRRINTELDVSSTTNTSMNVTVGSEIPNNSSFSFFGRGRKRDRTPPPQSQSNMELQTDADYSPPKRARLDMYTLFSVVSSPLTMLRSRFSRASIQSSTPVKLTSKLAAADEDEAEADVQNVSGISIEEENATDAADSDEKTATEDVTVGKNTDEDTTPKMDSPMKVDEKCGTEKGDEVSDELDTCKSSNVNEVAAGIADTSVSSAKNKRCNIM